MNWVLTIRRLLGRFWYDIFADNEFLLGIEYLLSSSSKLTENQYLNWVNGLIAKDTSVEQDEQPFLVYIAVDGKREWYTWEQMWEDGSAESLIDNTVDGTTGWIRYCKDPVPAPFYMTDHTINYQKVLIQGMDYDVYKNKFLFYTDPAELGLDIVKITDKDGMPRAYYRLFGYQKKTEKVCDPVTGFESSWLNDCSDIVWDIHQNGVTYYNMKQLLGKVTDSVICEKAGTVQSVWTEQGYNCMQVADKVYCSKYSMPTTQITYTPEPTQEDEDPEPVTVTVPLWGTQAEVEAHTAARYETEIGAVLFGALQVYKGTDETTATDVPGIRIQTDAGEMVALNRDNMEAFEVDGMCVLPLKAAPDVRERYKQICAANMKNAKCPNIQVPPTVNPYKFVTQVLRRGRSVTVRLVASSLDRLAAAISTIRKSCCASGMVNVYVAAEADTGTLTTSVFSADAGMMAVAVVETMTIKEQCAEAEVIL